MGKSTAKTTEQKQIEAARPSRPYTDYNIFFQLEREYILQNELEVKPNLDPSKVFDASDADYNGPPLPPRYSEIVLHKNWYKTGKGRKKRRHRITHGKIGFCELSKKIAAIWYDVDEVTKKFCEAASDACMLEYKKAMRLYNKSHNQCGAHSPKPNPKKKVKAAASAKKVVCVDLDEDESKRSEASTPVSSVEENESKNIAAKADDHDVLRDFVVVYLQNVNIQPTPQQSQSDLVDMEDEEILNMWFSHHVENNTHEESQQVSVEIALGNNYCFAQCSETKPPESALASPRQNSASLRSVAKSERAFGSFSCRYIANVA